MRFKLSLIFVTLLFITMKLNAGTIHFFMVIDRSDATIGAATDARLIKPFVEAIAEVTGMTLLVHEYDRYANNIATDLSSLQPAIDDVVWFYYSGHGSNSGDGWPQFNNSQQKYPATNIYDLLKAKRARLNITMFDACNIGQTIDAWGRTIYTPSNKMITLFKTAKGNLLLSSATDGNFSYGSPQTGGFMTSSFMEAITTIEYIANETPAALWARVLTLTKTKTNERCREARVVAQNPKWRGELNSAAAPPNVNDTPSEPRGAKLPSAFGNKN